MAMITLRQASRSSHWRQVTALGRWLSSPCVAVEAGARAAMVLLRQDDDGRGRESQPHIVLPRRHALGLTGAPAVDGIDAHHGARGELHPVERILAEIAEIDDLARD